MPTDQQISPNELHISLDVLGIDNQNTRRESIKPASPIIGLSLLTICTPPDSPSLSPIDDRYILRGHSQEPPIPTSCTSIDIALRGGLQYRRISSLSSAYGAPRSLLAMHAVASHLLAKPRGQVVWIDADGVFDPATLGKVIEGRLGTSGEVPVSSVLDRVQIYRVVDMQGLLEVIEEIKNDIGDECQITTDYNDDENFPQQEMEEKVIQDSQGGEDDWDDDESSMQQMPIGSQKEAVKRSQAEKSARPTDTVGLVVVDTITHLLSDLKFTPRLNSRSVKRNLYDAEDKWHRSEKLEAVTLFVDFCRAFKLLTKDREICLLLLNDVTAAPHGQDVYARNHELPPSRFHADTTVKPALGPVYAEYMDLSILLIKHHKEPGAEPGAEPGDIKLGKEPGSIEVRKGLWVAEVLNDRYGESIERWGVFMIEDTRLVDI